MDILKRATMHTQMKQGCGGYHPSEIALAGLLYFVKHKNDTLHTLEPTQFGFELCAYIIKSTFDGFLKGLVKCTLYAQNFLRHFL